MSTKTLPNSCYVCNKAIGRGEAVALAIVERQHDANGRPVWVLVHVGCQGMKHSARVLVKKRRRGTT